MNLFIDNYLTLRGVLKYLWGVRKSCYLPKDTVKANQYKRLLKLLNICNKKIPYYKELFEQIDFVPDRDFKTLEDIAKIPFTSKEDVRKNPEMFYNKQLLKKSIIFKTSGSTGNPLTCYASPNQWIMEQAMIWRHWSWANYRFRDKMAIVRSYAPKVGEPLIKHDKIRNFRYYSPFHLTDENIKYYLEDMVQEKVKFLRGYPSSVKIIAQYIQKNNPEIPKLKGILVASEILSEEDRHIIERTFKVNVTNHYGLVEGCILMGECEQHRGLHNYDEYGYLEFLDSELGSNIKEIVGTNLNNYAMPLIRYRTGDFAEMSEIPCPCTRSSMIVKNIIGRNSTVLDFDEVKIPLTNFYTLMEHFNSIEGWQIVQHIDKKIELIVHGMLADHDEQKIREGFAQRLPANAGFFISLNKPFILKHEGKKNPFVSLK